MTTEHETKKPDLDAILSAVQQHVDGHPIETARLRNLQILWTQYLRYLEDIQRRQPLGRSFPIYTLEDTYTLDYAYIGPKKLFRTWFEERKPTGSETIYPLPSGGYQWWILSWDWNDTYVNIRVSHWMIHHDNKLKRNTGYLTRYYQFSEDPGTDYTNPMAHSTIKVDEVPQKHRQRAHKAAAFVLDRQPDDWVRIISPYSVFEIIFNLHNLLKRLGMGEPTRYYLDKQFELHWVKLLQQFLWGHDEHGNNHIVRQYELDDYGLLTDDWYRPNTQHYLDAEQFEKVYDEWRKLRDDYERWITEKRQVMHGDTYQPG